MNYRSLSAAVVLLFALVPTLVHSQSTTYSLDLRFFASAADPVGSSNLFSFEVDTPAVQTQIGPVGSLNYRSFAMDFDSAGAELYVISGDAANFLNIAVDIGTVDFAGTGVYTPNALITGPLTGTTPSGLSVDPTDETFYVSTTTQLFTINPTTGVTTLVGTFGTAGGLVIDIAIDQNGQMFAHDIGDDSLYSINKMTAAATFIGPSLLAGNFAQGMDFDPATNVLYAAIYTGGGTGSYGTWDTTTGVFTQILDLPSFPDPTGNGRELEMAIRTEDKKGCANPLGDVNGDGVVSLLDVNPFVTLLTGGGFQCEADVNEDGVVSLLDVNPFVVILTGG